MKTTRKKIKREYTVDIQFHSYDLIVTATSQAEALKKGLAKLGRRSLKSMVDRNNTYVDRRD